MGKIFSSCRRSSSFVSANLEKNECQVFVDEDHDEKQEEKRDDEKQEEKRDNEKEEEKRDDEKQEESQENPLTTFVYSSSSSSADSVEEMGNIYLDVTTMKIRFNSALKSYQENDKHRLSEQIVKQYASQQCESCKLSDVLQDVTVPSDATHLIVSFCNFMGDQFSVPFSLTHQDDVFPFEDSDLIVNCDPTDLPHTISAVYMKDGKVVHDNITEHFLNFSWNLFNVGHKTFRVHAWTWLKDLYEDKEAVLLAKYGNDEFASISIADPKVLLLSV